MTSGVQALAKLTIRSALSRRPRATPGVSVESGVIAMRAFFICLAFLCRHLMVTWGVLKAEQLGNICYVLMHPVLAVRNQQLHAIDVERNHLVFVGNNDALDSTSLDER